MPTKTRVIVFPNDLTLREAKSLLIGVDVVTSLGPAHLGKPSPGLASPARISNLTAKTLILVPYLANGGLNERRKFSIRLREGSSPSRFPLDIVHYLHPTNHQALLALLGMQKVLKVQASSLYGEFDPCP
jgi:hypothetical protein